MDGLKTRSTLEVIEQLRDKQFSGKALPRDVRIEVVACLHYEGMSQWDISKLLGMGPGTVYRDMNVIKARNAKLVKKINVDRVAGNLVRNAEILKTKAVQVKNYALAWQIDRELIQMLQEMGYLRRAPEEHVVQHNVKATREDREKLDDEQLIHRLRSRGSEISN